MIQGFYTAGTGLRAQQTSLDTIANNLANVNTVGYKSMGVSFSDLMYQNLNRPVENPVMVGHGVAVSKSDLHMVSGGLQATNRALDFSIKDENGFFAAENAQGEIYYTRAGNFIMSNDDGEFYLALPNGDRVLDEDGSEIELEFDEEGNLVDFDPAMIGVYRFENPYGLQAIGGNRFAETPLSGPAEALEEPSIINGYLENANVELASEMAKIIEASKAFSFNSRMVQVADEVEQTVNQLR